MKYRPEVDGLRAVAVVSLVAYHAQFDVYGTRAFAGGFLGVDIFFVISGYLITGILLRAMRDRRFTCLGFYERRARRILPALFTVMIVSLPLAWIVLQPAAFSQYAGSLVPSVFFLSNLSLSSLDLSAPEHAVLQPFAHSWSLAVTGQFYFLYPIMLMGLWKLARRHLTSAFVTGFLISLAYAEWAGRHDPEPTFYLLPSRAWEFLAGALLAKLELDRGRPVDRAAGLISPAVGLALIVSALLFLPDRGDHPGLAILLPVCGTMLLIRYAGSGDPVTRLLSGRLFVGIGLISYSLYLWHQPLMVFTQIVYGGDLTNPVKAAVCLLAIALSALTWKLIEQPFRNTRAVGKRIMILSLTGSAAILVAAGIAAIGNHGDPSRSRPAISDIFAGIQIPNHVPHHTPIPDPGADAATGQ